MEQWLPVVGWVGLYEVSDHGRVRSVEREMMVTRGGATFVRKYKGKILSPGPAGDCGHLAVNLCRHGQQHLTRIHHLVLEAFVEPRPEGKIGLHKDDNPSNNHLSNLRWGTYSDNQLDKVRNGNHHNSNKTRCPQDHEYTIENTRWVDGRRYCIICVRKKNREAEARRRARRRS